MAISELEGFDCVHCGSKQRPARLDIHATEYVTHWLIQCPDCERKTWIEWERAADTPPQIDFGAMVDRISDKHSKPFGGETS